jgi:hypothetical protein
MARIGLVIAALALVVPDATAQTTWYVDGTGTAPGSGTQLDPYTSVQFAISQPTTLSGDTLLVATGVYFESIDLLGKSLHIAGDGAGQTFLDGGGAGRVVRYSPGSGGVLRDLTVRNGWALAPGDDRGGGVWIEDGSPELRRVIVRDCVAQIGAGIAIDGGSPWIVESSITFNGIPAPSTAWGAGIYASCVATPLVEDSDITFNKYTDFGGGVAGSGTYRNCQIDDNLAKRGGGAHALGCSLTFEDCSLSRNTAGDTGSDLFEGGGAIGPAMLVRCTLEDNLANLEGGGALDCTLIDSTLRGNVLDNFGTSGVVARGAGAARSTLSGCLVESNRVGGGGAGVDFLRGDGAGVWDCDVSASTLRDNLARNGRGGGAFESTLTDCRLEANEARLGADAGTGEGGGAADSTLSRCILIDNEAEHGAGVADSSLDFCTLTDNAAVVSGGAVHDEPGAATLANSILWSNSPDEIVDVSGLLTVRYSLVEGGWPGPAILNADPLFFAPVARDVHLKSTSPCLDAGDPASPLDTDGSVADIGALPYDSLYCAAPQPWCVGKLTSQGCTPAVTSTGSASLSSPEFLVIHCNSLVEQKLGFMFWGPDPMSVPFANGVRCVGQAFRTPAQNSAGELPPATCTGNLQFAFTPAYAALNGVAAGDTIYAQWFSRDPANPDGTGVSLSNGLEVTFCP